MVCKRGGVGLRRERNWKKRWFIYGGWDVSVSCGIRQKCGAIQSGVEWENRERMRIRREVMICGV